MKKEQSSSVPAALRAVFFPAQLIMAMPSSSIMLFIGKAYHYSHVQVRKLRHRGLKWLAQDDPADHWQSPKENPVLLSPGHLSNPLGPFKNAPLPGFVNWRWLRLVLKVPFLLPRCSHIHKSHKIGLWSRRWVRTNEWQLSLKNSKCCFHMIRGYSIYSAVRFLQYGKCDHYKARLEFHYSTASMNLTAYNFCSPFLCPFYKDFSVEHWKYSIPNASCLLKSLDKCCICVVMKRIFLQMQNSLSFSLALLWMKNAGMTALETQVAFYFWTQL